MVEVLITLQKSSAYEIEENVGIKIIVSGDEIVATDEDSDPKLVFSIDWENTEFIKEGITVDETLCKQFQ